MSSQDRISNPPGSQIPSSKERTSSADSPGHPPPLPAERRLKLLEAQLVRMEKALHDAIPRLDSELSMVRRRLDTSPDPVDSQDPSGKQLAQCLEAIADLRSKLESLEKRLGAPGSTEKDRRLRELREELESRLHEIEPELRSLHQNRKASQEERAREMAEIRRETALRAEGVEHQLSRIERRFDAAFRVQQEEARRWRWLLLVGVIATLLIALLR